MGSTVKQLLKQAGMSYADFANEMGMSKSWAQYCADKDSIPAKHRERAAEVLGVELGDIGGAPAGRAVRGSSELEVWRDRVDLLQSPGLTPTQKWLTAALRHFFDEELGAVHCTIPHVADRLQVDEALVRKNWDAILDSPFVERIGSVKWLLRLKFPE